VSGVRGQGDTVRLHEPFAKDTHYHVQCQVDITGTLTLPGNGKEVAKPIAVSGKSAIRYDERILRTDAGGCVERTIRQYRQLEFERKVGGEEQHNRLRTDVARLVLLRQNQYEVPFCPTGPLNAHEVELVRTDVFSPALKGLLPDKAVRPGDQWNADPVALQELTDLEKIDKADFLCTFEKITILLGKRTAHVQFQGKIHGIGEDGPALHELRGSYYFDLDASFLTYVYVKGTHHLLDKAGKPSGKIDGTFVMTRSQAAMPKELSDDALRGLTLEPTADNTLLVFEHPQVGARFLYPRNWRIAGFNDKQIGIDENKGSGVLITLAPATQTPTAVQFFHETAQFLSKQQARIVRHETPRAMQGGWETFSFDAEIGKERVVLNYYTTRQGTLGATMTARLLPAQMPGAQADVERMARTLQLRAVK
jgi:hypothetical protein